MLTAAKINLESGLLGIVGILCLFISALRVI